MNQHVRKKGQVEADPLVTRIAALRAEWTQGQRQLETLDAERARVRDLLLRIGGAIQVLEELSATEAG